MPLCTFPSGLHIPPTWVPKFSLNMVASHLPAASEQAARSNQLAPRDWKDSNLPRVYPGYALLCPRSLPGVQASKQPLLPGQSWPGSVGRGSLQTELGRRTCIIQETRSTLLAPRACARPHRFSHLLRPRAHQPSAGRAHPPHNASLLFRCSWPGCCRGWVFSIGSCVW